MRFSNLTVENFRPIKVLSLDLNKMTVLDCPSDVGKALHLLGGLS